MELYRVVKGNLARQSLEGRLIDNFQGKYSLNNKGEWGHNQAPRLVVQGEEEDAGKGTWRGRKRARLGDPGNQGEHEGAIGEQEEPVPAHQDQDRTPREQRGQGEAHHSNDAEEGHLSTVQQRPLTIKQMLARMKQSGKERANKTCPRGEKAELGFEGQESNTRAEPSLSTLQNDDQALENTQ